jgi:hypothetical protein
VHPRFRSFLALLAAVCLGLGVGSCSSSGDPAGGEPADGGAGGPEEETGVPPLDDDDGGAGGPLEEGGVPMPLAGPPLPLDGYMAVVVLDGCLDDPWTVGALADPCAAA